MSIKVMNWVWEHSDAAGTELLMLLAIADHADDDGTNAWPSRTTLAAKTRLDERTVRRVIKRLEAAGQLRVQRGHGRSNSNRYIVVMANANGDGVHRREMGAARPGAVRPPGSSPWGAVPPEKGAFDPQKGVAAPPEPSLTVQEPSKRYLSPPDSTDFEAFWSIYPRRKAKQAAHKAWTRAIRSGADPATLIAAAERFAAQRSGQDAKFTPHPATWLTQARWHDEPDAPPLRLVAGDRRPFRNPADQSVYEEDLL
ncbi:MAG: helix-turn-helix domain-containing protein [Haloechinothrix sp.]